MIAVHASMFFSKRLNVTHASKLIKNLKSFIPLKSFTPLKLCNVPNKEIQIDFGGPIYNEKNQEVFFLACIDRFSEFPTAEVSDKCTKYFKISSRTCFISWNSSYN